MMWEEIPKPDLKKRNYKISFAWTISIILLLLVGAMLCIAFLTVVYGINIGNLTSEHWSLIATLCLIALYLTNIYRVKEERKHSQSQKDRHTQEIESVQADSSVLRSDFERFKKDSINAFKAHLKVSILFWIHYYKKEKVKSLEDTRKEIFKDLRKEYAQVTWMDEILDELSHEIGKYKDPKAKKEVPPKEKPEAEM